MQPASPPASVPARPNRAVSVQASSGSMGRGPGNRGREPARVFALTRQDAQASNVVMTGTLSVCSHKAYVLFDPGSTHSYISPCFAKKLDRDPTSLHCAFMVATPMGEFLLVNDVYRSCEISI